MNFKRFLLLAIFLMAPGMIFAGGTIQDVEYQPCNLTRTRELPYGQGFVEKDAQSQ